jgi:tetratricopeptide (TPR) repeat protein
MDTLSTAEIAVQIGQGLDFLATEWRGVPARQQSMQAVFDASWAMLRDVERDAFARLSVFRGGFTAQAAEAVVGADLRTLRGLVHKSFLEHDPAPAAGRGTGGRYAVHELLRQYGQAHLDRRPEEKKETLDRHGATYATAVQRWEAALHGPRQLATLSEMDIELANVLAAWDRAGAQLDAGRLNQLVGGLGHYLELRGRPREAESLFRTTSATLDAAFCDGGPSPPSSVARRVLAKMVAWEAKLSTQHKVDHERIERCRALLADPALTGPDARRDRAFVLLMLGQALVQISVGQAEELLVASLDIYRALDDKWGAAYALTQLAFVKWLTSRYDEARRDGYESLELSRSVGSLGHTLMSMSWVMIIAATLGRIEELRQLECEYAALSRELGGLESAAIGFLTRANRLRLEGQHAEAAAQYGQVVEVYRQLGADILIARFTAFQAEASRWAGAYERARSQAHQVLDIAQERGAPRLKICGIASEVLGSVALAEGAWAEARPLFAGSADIYRENRAQDNLGQVSGCLCYAEHRLGHRVEAGRHLRKALQVSVEVPTFTAVLYALSISAVLLADQGQVERAAELYALATRYPFVANSRWFEDVAGRPISAAAAALPPEAIAAAQERGRARELEATMRELLVELGGDVDQIRG